MAAGVGLYMLAMDGERSPECYSAATTRDQAKITWSTAREMVKHTPALRSKLGIQALAHSIAVERDGAFFKPLSRDSDSMEGINAHLVVVDELAAHKDRSVFDVLDERTGARAQPLSLYISTEGDGSTGAFPEQVGYLQEILAKRYDDDSYFGVIYTLDKSDDWTLRASWYKANPNLGVSIFENDFADRCLRAQRNPASQASFLTKRLNVRVGAGEAYFNMLAWNNLCRSSELKIEDFYGKPCILALDLASKIDLAAKVYLFPLKDKFHPVTKAPIRYAIFSQFYIPEERLEKGNPNYDYYRGWSDPTTGYLTTTPGNVIDFEFIEEDLRDDMKTFKVREVGFDPFQATELSTRMAKEGLPMVEIPQTVRQMSEPMKGLGALVDSGGLVHDGNPVLTWMIGNTTARVDVKENVFPRKVRPENKIDGSVALIMGHSRIIVLTPAKQSVYERRGMRFLG